MCSNVGVLWVLFIGDIVLAILCFVFAALTPDMAVLMVCIGCITAFTAYAMWNSVDELRCPR